MRRAATRWVCWLVKSSHKAGPSPGCTQGWERSLSSARHRQPHGLSKQLCCRQAGQGRDLCCSAPGAGWAGRGGLAPGPAPCLEGRAPGALWDRLHGPAVACSSHHFGNCWNPKPRQGQGPSWGWQYSPRCSARCLRRNGKGAERTPRAATQRCALLRAWPCCRAPRSLSTEIWPAGARNPFGGRQMQRSAALLNLVLLWRQGSQNKSILNYT